MCNCNNKLYRNPKDKTFLYKKSNNFLYKKGGSLFNYNEPDYDYNFYNQQTPMSYQMAGKKKYQVAGPSKMTNESGTIPSLLELTTPELIGEYNKRMGLPKEKLPISKVDYYTRDAKKIPVYYQTKLKNQTVDIPTAVFNPYITEQNLKTQLEPYKIVANDTTYYNAPTQDVVETTYSDLGDYLNTLLYVPVDYAQLGKKVAPDKSESINLGITNAPEKAKFLQNIKVSKKYLNEVFRLADKYDLSPYTLMAASMIEKASKGTITADMFFNTHNLVLKEVEKAGIPNSQEAVTYLNKKGIKSNIGKLEEKDVNDLLEYYNKESGYTFNTPDYESRLVNKALTQWYPKIKKIREDIANNADNYLELLAMYLDRNGVHTVNPAQEQLKDVKYSYEDMIKSASEYLKTVPMLKNYKTK